MASAHGWTLWVGVAVFCLVACGEDADEGAQGAATVATVAASSSSSAGGVAAGGAGGGKAAERCSYPLIALQTGKDASCAGGQTHRWPVGMPADFCHGWQGVDSMGGTHDNSANAIQCNADGSFSFTQFANSLVCEGSGVTKTFKLNVCEQDIPPVLYTQAVDLSCCTDPESPDCQRGIPSIEAAGSIFLNGIDCAAE